MDNFNTTKWFKDQYLKEAYSKLNEESISPYEMEKENDIKKLIKIINDETGLEFDDSVRGSMSDGRRGYYIRMAGRGNHYFESDDVLNLKKAFEEVNKITDKFDYEYSSVSDYETDIDDDRTWAASVSFFAEPKKDKLNEIHSKSKELADDYSMDELKDRLSQLYRDMEQEAEPEGGPISDQYADEITFHEDAIRLKKGLRKKDMPYDVAIGKMTQDEYDTVVSKDDFNKSSQFDRMDEGEWTYEFGELDESASTEEKRIALRAIKSIAKYRGVSEDEAKRDLIRAAKELGGLKEAINDIKETIKLGKTLNEELCAKGKAYRKRRMAAGEKSSAYLSGRAVKVCKGQMSGKKKKK